VMDGAEESSAAGGGAQELHGGAMALNSGEADRRLR
jgi:hypothetical protein